MTGTFVKKLTCHGKDRTRGEMEDYKKVVADLDKTIELEPNHAVAYHSRGSAKRIMGDYKEAIADHDKAIELDPNHADGYWFRGMAKDGIGDYREAIADFDKAIELEPNHANAHFSRGTAKGEMGDQRVAIAELNKQIELDPENADFYEAAIQNIKNRMYQRGLSKLKMEDYEGAIEDFHKAIELNPGNAYRYRESINAAKKKLDDQFKLTQSRSQPPSKTKLHKIVNSLKKNLYHIVNLLVFGVVFEFWDCSNAYWMMSGGTLLFFSCYLIYWPYYRIHGEYDWTTCKDFYPEPFLIKVSALFCVWGLIMLLAGGLLWLWCPS